MPIFNINNALKTSTMSVPFGDENVLDFMTGDNSNTYISAKEALKILTFIQQSFNYLEI